MAAFDRFSDTAYRRVALIVRESAKLVSLRDALLPKLIAGEVRVGEAEKLVESVT